jgi:hypothetical protein
VQVVRVQSAPKGERKKEVIKRREGDTVEEDAIMIHQI